MSNVGSCPFYRVPVNLNIGRGLGHCDLEGSQAICEGDSQCCDKPDAMRKQLLEQKKKISNGARDENHGKDPLRCKVLVVDDEEPMRKLIVALLSEKGHECITANNGAEAVNKVYQNKFDAVITDIAMPEMDGLTLTKTLLSIYPNLPIMVMTGYASEYSPESVITAGARDFVEKPFSFDEIILRFNKMMYDHQVLLRMQEKLKEGFLGSQRTS
jgi:CheY-like chemotaxis protein